MNDMSEWISVEDKLPAVGAQCLVIQEPVYLNATDVAIRRKVTIAAYMECGQAVKWDG